MIRPRNILFVCTGNTCRSPMAEYLLKDKFNSKGIKDISVYSRGTAVIPESFVSPNSVIVVREYGHSKEIDIPIQKHNPYQISPMDIAQSDVIFTMSNSHLKSIEKMLFNITNETPEFPAEELFEKCFAFKDYMGYHGNIPDPFGEDIKVYKQTRDELAFLIDELTQEF